MYRSEILHRKDFAFAVKSSSHKLTIDAKGNEGISPPDALLASIGTCLGVYIRKYAQSSGLALENFSVNVEAEFSKETPMRFKVINVAIDLKNNSLDERRKAALSEFIKNCPVHNTLKESPRVDIKIL